jgi:hypothetical protein
VRIKEAPMSEAKKLTDKYRLDQWSAIIQECIKSGKPVNEWCTENNVSRDRYYYWLRKVKLAVAQENTEMDTPQTPKIVPLLPPSSVYEANDLKTAIILKVNDIILEIQDCASDAIIERTLKIIKRIC